MDRLRLDSIEVIATHPTEIDTLYEWMDIGSTLAAKMRTGKPLTVEDQSLINRLTYLLKSVVTTSNITVYRGVGTIPDKTFAAPQFNATSPVLEASEEYGEVMSVFVPVGTNCFYISAWEYFATDVEESIEKEVLLPPGEFIRTDNGDYIFYQDREW